MGHFFTVSGGWNIQNETFFESLRESVNQLKVRVSYGSLGNTPGAYYGHYPLYSSMMYNDEVAYFPSQMGECRPVVGEMLHHQYRYRRTVLRSLRSHHRPVQ